MKSLIFLSALAFGQVGAIIVETNLGAFSKAVVYNGNIAEIERVVTVNSSLTVDEYHGVVVKGFVPNVKEETIRILSSIDVEVLDFKLSTSLVVKESTAEYKKQTAAYNEQLIGLRRDVSSYRNEITVLENKMKFINEYTNRLSQLSSSSSTNTMKTLEEIVAAVEYQESQAKKYYETVAIFNQKIEDANALITEVNEKISKMSRYASQQRSSVEAFDKTEKVLTFRIKPSREPSVEDPLKFFITYTSTTASWSPEYDIRIESIAPPALPRHAAGQEGSGGSVKDYRMEIDYFANVWQNTGEHWVDAMLTLSTAKPQYLQKHGEAHTNSVGFDHPTPAPSSSPSSAPNTRPSARPSSQPYAVHAQNDHSSHHYTGAASMKQAESFSAGDLGASHMFKVQYPVNVSSTDLLGLEQQTAAETNSALQTYKHLILVEKVVVDCQVFTFAVPSQDSRGFMMGWGKHSAPKGSSASAATRSPLLASYQARLAIQGSSLGTVAFSTVMPGEKIKLSLGFDQQIHISTAAVRPTHKGQEEDKSTWFVTDKKKFRVRTDERTTTIRSSHTTKTVLVIVSENLPRSTEEDGVKVELLSPEAKSLLLFDGETYINNDDCIAAVLEKESADPSLKLSSDSRVYFNKLSGNLYWAQWVAPGESVSLQYKYKITWPDEKNINLR